MADEISQKIQKFFAAYPAIFFQKGEMLARAGEDLPGVLYLVKGLVRQYDIAPNGAVIVVNVYKPGAFFPMSWAINRTPNDYFFEAITDIEVRRAAPEEAIAFLRNEPEVLFNLLSRVYHGTDGLLRRMAHLMGGDAQSRLQFELLNAAYRFGEYRPDGSIFVPMTENELGNHSGLARETVSRNMQKLKAANLINVAQEGIVLRDPAGLEQLLSNRL